MMFTRVPPTAAPTQLLYHKHLFESPLGPRFFSSFGFPFPQSHSRHYIPKPHLSRLGLGCKHSSLFWAPVDTPSPLFIRPAPLPAPD
uniref:RNA-dependent RNA polymerase n=1 Tax=Heterobasidion ourmia-like virus 5 TaxID=3075973 RepID=A0AA95Z281_9VIRU|nr:RNA-dependent RNA polymerase [Heterobasidion ourmia-like virus 5]